MARTVTSAIRLFAAAAACAAALLSSAISAEAQSWREYRYSGFAIRFPVEPTVENGTYTTAEGAVVDARIYSAEQEGALYKVTVADLSRVHQSEAQAIGEAVGGLSENGDVVVDIAHRVNGVLGRQLSIVSHDGSRSTIALFYRNRRLYLVEGTILPTHDDPMSPDGARFQQSLRFIIPNARVDFPSDLRRGPLNFIDGTR
jgi:hypothetical protein